MNQSRLILLTGGTGLLGQILARDLAKAGYDLVLIGRNNSRLESINDQLRTGTPEACITPLVVDLSSVGAVSRLMGLLDERSLHPYGIVHCARNLEYMRQDDQGYVSRTDWVSEFSLDVVVPYELTVGLAARPGSGLKSVVVVSSMYGVTPPKPVLYNHLSEVPPIHYGVCKAAQLQLTRELSVRLSPQGIRVNAVSYGGLRGRVDSAFEERYSAQCPSGRMLNSDDVAGPVLFLLSAQSAATTGHNLLAEGGWTVW